MSKRRKVSKEEKKQKVEPWMKDLMDLIPINTLQKYFASPREFWKTRNMAEKIEAMKYISKHCPRDSYHPIKISINSIQPLSRVYELYEKYFGKRTSIHNRETVVFELVYKFFGETSPLERRKSEEKNLQTFDKDMDKELDFVSFGGINLPHEMTKEILSFLPRDYDTLVNIGGGCKALYIFLLLSWSSVTTTKLNFHSISLLVLKNVRTVILQGITLKLQGLLWEKRINPTKLRELKIKAYGSNYCDSVLNNLKKRKFSRITNNITHLDLDYLNNYFKGKIHKTFPNLVYLSVKRSSNYNNKIPIYEFSKFKKLRTIRFGIFISPKEINSSKSIQNIHYTEVGFFSNDNTDNNNNNKKKEKEDYVGRLLNGLDNDRNINEIRFYDQVYLSGLNQNGGNKVRHCEMINTMNYYYFKRCKEIVYPISTQFESFKILNHAKLKSGKDNNTRIQRIFPSTRFGFIDLVDNLLYRNTIRHFVAEIPLRALNNFKEKEGPPTKSPSPPVNPNEEDYRARNERKERKKRILKKYKGKVFLDEMNKSLETFSELFKNSVTMKYDHFELKFIGFDEIILIRFQKQVLTALHTTTRRFYIKFKSSKFLLEEDNSSSSSEEEEEEKEEVDEVDESNIAKKPLEMVLKKFVEDVMLKILKNVDFFVFDFGWLCEKEEEEEKLENERKFRNEWLKYLRETQVSTLCDVKEDGSVFFTKKN